MERLDSATTGLIEQDVKGRFPEGVLDSVTVLQYGDDPAVEPGQVVVQLTVGPAAEPEDHGAPPEPFPRAYRTRSSSSSAISSSDGPRPPGSDWSAARARAAACSSCGRPGRRSRRAT